MNINLYNIPHDVMNVPPYSPEYDVACAICDVRGLVPFNVEVGSNLMNWQKVIAEQRMFEMMSQVR